MLVKTPESLQIIPILKYVCVLPLGLRPSLKTMDYQNLDVYIMTTDYHGAGRGVILMQ